MVKGGGVDLLHSRYTDIYGSVPSSSCVTSMEMLTKFHNLFLPKDQNLTKLFYFNLNLYDTHITVNSSVSS